LAPIFASQYEGVYNFPEDVFDKTLDGEELEEESEVPTTCSLDAVFQAADMGQMSCSALLTAVATPLFSQGEEEEEGEEEGEYDAEFVGEFEAEEDLEVRFVSVIFVQHCLGCYGMLLPAHLHAALSACICQGQCTSSCLYAGSVDRLLTPCSLMLDALAHAVMLLQDLYGEEGWEDAVGAVDEEGLPGSGEEEGDILEEEEEGGLSGIEGSEGDSSGAEESGGSDAEVKTGNKRKPVVSRKIPAKGKGKGKATPPDTRYDPASLCQCRLCIVHRGLWPVICGPGSMAMMYMLQLERSQRPPVAVLSIAGDLSGSGRPNSKWNTSTNKSLRRPPQRSGRVMAIIFTTATSTTTSTATATTTSTTTSTATATATTTATTNANIAYCCHPSWVERSVSWLWKTEPRKCSVVVQVFQSEANFCMSIHTVAVCGATVIQINCCVFHCDRTIKRTSILSNEMSGVGDQISVNRVIVILPVLETGLKGLVVPGFRIVLLFGANTSVTMLAEAYSMHTAV